MLCKNHRAAKQCGSEKCYYSHFKRYSFYASLVLRLVLNLLFTGTGVVTALLSLPLRYMHCPCEVCHMDDIENCIELLAQFLCRIDEHIDLDPFH